MGTTPNVQNRALRNRSGLSVHISVLAMAGLVSLHQLETQRLLGRLFFERILRAGLGRAEAGGAETFVNAGRLVRTNLPSMSGSALEERPSYRRSPSARYGRTPDVWLVKGADYRPAGNLARNPAVC